MSIVCGIEPPHAPMSTFYITHLNMINVRCIVIVWVDSIKPKMLYNKSKWFSLQRIALFTFCAMLNACSSKLRDNGIKLPRHPLLNITSTFGLRFLLALQASFMWVTTCRFVTFFREHTSGDAARRYIKWWGRRESNPLLPDYESEASAILLHPDLNW